MDADDMYERIRRSLDVIDLYACLACGTYAVVGYVCCGVAIVLPPVMCERTGCTREAYGTLVIGPFQANACLECAREFDRRVRG